jgi:hypothetical protein
MMSGKFCGYTRLQVLLWWALGELTGASYPSSILSFQKLKSNSNKYLTDLTGHAVLLLASIKKGSGSQRLSESG